MKVDNFALTNFQTCPSKYDLRIRQDWDSRTKSPALLFGGVMHEGLAAWYLTGSLAEAIRAINDSWPASSPPDDYRNLGKAIEVMTDYTKKYPSEKFRVIEGMVEVPFTIATDMYLNCATCQIALPSPYTQDICENCGLPLEEIEYGGIFDGLIEFGPVVYILEHKTTSQLGSMYFNQFKPNNQVTGYIWAAQLLSGRSVAGALINAIGAYRVGKTKFERDITTRSQIMIAEWKLHIRTICQAIKDCEQRGVFPMHTAACTLYSGCEFRKVHVLPESKDRQSMLETAFVRRRWDFENRDAPEKSQTISHRAPLDKSNIEEVDKR